MHPQQHARFSSYHEYLRYYYSDDMTFMPDVDAFAGSERTEPVSASSADLVRQSSDDLESDHREHEYSFVNSHRRSSAQNTATTPTDQLLASHVESRQSSRDAPAAGTFARSQVEQQANSNLAEALARAGLSDPDRIPLGMADGSSFVARRREAWGQDNSIYQSLFPSANQPMHSTPQTQFSFAHTPHHDNRVFGRSSGAPLQRSSICRPDAYSYYPQLSERPSHSLAGAGTAICHAPQTAAATAPSAHQPPFPPAASFAPSGNATANPPVARSAFTLSAASAAIMPTAPAVQAFVQQPPAGYPPQTVPTQGQVWIPAKVPHAIAGAGYARDNAPQFAHLTDDQIFAGAVNPSDASCGTLLLRLRSNHENAVLSEKLNVLWRRLDKEERTANNIAVAVRNARKHFAKLAGITEEQAWDQQVQDRRNSGINQTRTSRRNMRNGDWSGTEGLFLVGKTRGRTKTARKKKNAAAATPSADATSTSTPAAVSTAGAPSTPHQNEESSQPGAASTLGGLQQPTVDNSSNGAEQYYFSGQLPLPEFRPYGDAAAPNTFLFDPALPGVEAQSNGATMDNAMEPDSMASTLMQLSSYLAQHLTGPASPTYPDRSHGEPGNSSAYLTGGMAEATGYEGQEGLDDALTSTAAPTESDVDMDTTNGSATAAADNTHGSGQTADDPIELDDISDTNESEMYTDFELWGEPVPQHQVWEYETREGADQWHEEEDDDGLI